MSIKHRIHVRIKNGSIAISLFAFMLSIAVCMFLLKDEIIGLKSYIEIFTFQLQNISISKSRIFLFVLEKRLIHFVILLLTSGILKNRYKSLLFYGIFFFLYGIFFFTNICLLGFKGIITGFLCIVPHWIIYIFVYSRLFRNDNGIKNIKIIEILLMIMGIFAASILETYVNLFFITKIL